MANLEKHPKRPIEQLEQADFSAVSTHARSPRLVGSYIKKRQSDFRRCTSGRAPAAHPVILRLEDLPATPCNLERMRERVRRLNHQLAASGTPFRLRVI